MKRHSIATELSHHFISIVPNPHACAVEVGRLGLSESCSHGVVNGSYGEYQPEEVSELEPSLAQRRPARLYRFNRACGWKSAQTPLAFADGRIMEISGPIHPQGNSDPCVRIGGEVTVLIPVSRLKSTEALLLTASDKIVMIPAQKVASRDGDSHVRMNLQITTLVPVC